MDTKQVKTWRTINEIRKEHGEKPLENGDIILDPSYLNYIQQKEMASQGGGMGTPMGDGTEDMPDEEQSDDYSDYDSEETNDDSQETSDEQGEPQVDDYSEYEVDSGEEKAEKSLSKLIISLEE